MGRVPIVVPQILCSRRSQVMILMSKMRHRPPTWEMVIGRSGVNSNPMSEDESIVNESSVLTVNWQSVDVSFLSIEGMQGCTE